LNQYENVYKIVEISSFWARPAHRGQSRFSWNDWDQSDWAFAQPGSSALFVGRHFKWAVYLWYDNYCNRFVFSEIFRGK